MKSRIEKYLNDLGIAVNGDKPYDLKVHDNRLFDRILSKQSIGAGECYMEGMWDCDQLDELFYRICRKKAEKKFYSPFNTVFLNIKNTLINQQSRSKADDVANVHYNLGSTLFERMLGKSLAYTCGYWKDANTLDDAQFNKYELICKKLMLKPGETVLELGCGMGGLAKYMAEKYQCEVTAFDISPVQASYAKTLCQGLPVHIFQCDYRDTHLYNLKRIKFDKLVSVGVLEHVGYKNYDLFLTLCREFIKDEGIFLLHFIGSNTSIRFCEPWIDKYIFPHGMLPSLKQLSAALENKFIIEDYHNFGAYYDKTLMAWHQNLNSRWDELKSHYDERFLRMMNYYLLSCAGGFRARGMQLWQFVLTTNGMLQGYNRVF